MHQKPSFLRIDYIEKKMNSHFSFLFEKIIERIEKEKLKEKERKKLLLIFLLFFYSFLGLNIFFFSTLKIIINQGLFYFLPFIFNIFFFFKDFLIFFFETFPSFIFFLFLFHLSLFLFSLKKILEKRQNFVLRK